MTPKVFYRITDNWVEMTIRFITGEHGARDVKDAMARRILDEFDRAGIGIASSTYDIVGWPPITMAPATVAAVIDRITDTDRGGHRRREDHGGGGGDGAHLTTAR